MLSEAGAGGQMRQTYYLPVPLPSILGLVSLKSNSDFMVDAGPGAQLFPLFQRGL